MQTDENEASMVLACSLVDLLVDIGEFKRIDDISKLNKKEGDKDATD